MIVVGETEKCNVKCNMSSESDMSNDLAGVAAGEASHAPRAQAGIKIRNYHSI